MELINRVGAPVSPNCVVPFSIALSFTIIVRPLDLAQDDCKRIKDLPAPKASCSTSLSPTPFPSFDLSLWTPTIHSSRDSATPPISPPHFGLLLTFFSFSLYTSGAASTRTPTHSGHLVGASA